MFDPCHVHPTVFTSCICLRDTLSECLWSIACISSSLEKKVCVKKWWSCTDCICSRSIVKVSGEVAIYQSTVLISRHFSPSASPVGKEEKPQCVVCLKILASENISL